MDETKRIILALCLMAVVIGCSEKQADKAQQKLNDVSSPPEIVRLMDRMTNDFFASETRSGNLDYSQIAGSLLSVSNAEVKLQLLDQLMGRILSLDISVFDYRTQCNAMSSVETVANDVVLRGLYSRRRASLEDYHELYYDFQLRYLDWMRKQIQRTAPKHRVDDPEAYVDGIRQENLFWWRRLHYGSISSYESKLSSLESFYHAYARRISSDSAERIKRRIERFLGRPIRTREQIMQDSKDGRHVEFVGQSDPLAAP